MFIVLSYDCYVSCSCMAVVADLISVCGLQQMAYIDG